MASPDVPCPVCGSAAFVRHTRHAAYVRCDSCGLLRNEPFPTPQDVERYYAGKSAAGNYSASIAAFDEQRKGVYRAYLRVLERETGLQLRGAKVLDAGCFTGLSLEALPESGASPYGLEYQPEAARIAESKFPGRVVNADICAAMGLPHAVDVVTMTDVIEHVPSPAAALRAVRAALKPGGRLLLTTPDTSSLMARLLGRYWPSYSPIHHLHLFDGRNLERLLRQEGFDPLYARPLWKTYSLEYVRWILQHQHPGAASILKALPRFISKAPLPLNGGERIVIARAVRR
jgi:SAM-dependent methyltransferase